MGTSQRNDLFDLPVETPHAYEIIQLMNNFKDAFIKLIFDDSSRV